MAIINGAEISIQSPSQAQDVPSGRLGVVGLVGCGTVTQEDVPAVTVRLDKETPVTATVNTPGAIPHTNRLLASFACEVNVPQNDTSFPVSHVITAIATYSASNSLGATVAIFARGSVFTPSFKGACIAKSALILSSFEQIEFQLNTLSDPPAVEITRFPHVTFPAVGLAAGVTLEVTMSLNSGGTGTVDDLSGSMSIPDVVLNVNAILSVANPNGGTIDFPASSTFTTTLTTEQTSSGESLPVFTDNGQRWEGAFGTRHIRLVGDGKYSSPIFGMTDAGISLGGIFTLFPS